MFGIEGLQQTYKIPRPPGRGVPRPPVGVTAIDDLRSGTHQVEIRVLDPIDFDEVVSPVLNTTTIAREPVPPEEEGALGEPIVSAEADGTTSLLLSTPATPLSIAIEDRNEPPTLRGGLFPIFVPENATAGTVLGIVHGDDPDMYQDLTFSVTGTLQDYFELRPILTSEADHRAFLESSGLLKQTEAIPCEVRAKFARQSGIVRSAELVLALDALDYESVRAYGVDINIQDDAYLNILRSSIGSGLQQRYSFLDPRGNTIPACVGD